MEIGKRIKYLREAKGYSINKPANMDGVSQSYLRDLELGNKNPTISFLSLLCEQLEINLKDFFDDISETSFENDPLVHRLYQMTPSQREKLLAFLNALE